MSKHAPLSQATRAEQTRERTEANPRAVAATIRWAQVLPVDFDGEDASLTQAQLALLK
jgi:hypothetical protein